MEYEVGLNDLVLIVVALGSREEERFVKVAIEVVDFGKDICLGEKGAVSFQVPHFALDSNSSKDG